MKNAIKVSLILGMVLLICSLTPVVSAQERIPVGSSFPVSASVTQVQSQGYALPFPEGASYKLLQGFNGPWGHAGHAEFAYDFEMPIGSRVVAARSGEVVHIVEIHENGTRKPGQENVLVIKHSDGTYGRYYHLTSEGALVSVGDKVRQGQKIALSGNSGASAGPHLHFDVTKDCYDWGCQTIRIEFDNVSENPLTQGKRYKSTGF